MEAIERNILEGIAVEKINFVRATMNEAFKIKNNLTEDSLDYSKIIVDLSCCDYIDSTFLGALIYSFRNITSRKAIMVLVIGETQLSKSFIYKEILKMFRVYGTLCEAIAELNKEEKKETKKLRQTQLSCTDIIDIINY